MRPAWLMFVTVGCSTPGASLFGPYAVDPEAIRRACAMEVSCFANPPLSPGGSCVSQLELGLATGNGVLFGPSASDIDRYVKCSASADSCADALNCASRNHGPEWCDTHPDRDCDGDSLISCIQGWGLQITDCARLGLRCMTNNGYSECANGKPCDPATLTHCDGNRVVSCSGSTGLEFTVECGLVYSGGTCYSNPSLGGSDTGCRPPPSASCAGDGATCVGNTAVICSQGAELRVACGQFASHCAIDTMGAWSCVPDANRCSSSSPDACAGDALEICVNGNLVSTPCGSIGLVTCDWTGGTAHCR